MINPFADPEIRRAMAAAGVVHTPGMANELMAELAPLLAAEGIDLDDLGDRTIEDVNAALARATEQHNLALSMPVGAQRDNAIAVLRAVTRATMDNDDDRAEAILASIQPDARGSLPSVAHVIGVAVGMLDEWLGRSGAVSMSGTRFPAWSSGSRAAASDVLTRAKTGSAFASLEPLTLLHGGRFLLWGAALGVAVTARTRVARERLTLDELLPGGDELLIAGIDFETWLTDGGVSGAREQAAFLASLPQSVEGLDLRDPTSVQRFIDLLFEDRLDIPEDIADATVSVLHDYVEFRMEVDAGPGAWEAVHAVFEDDSSTLAPDLFATAVAASAAVPIDERLAFLRATRPVGAIPALIEWLGASRPVSQTGAVRRADIAEVAGMLGVDARGVAKRPLGDGSSAMQFVTSMRELPVIDAWWEALSIADVIDVAATRVHPGSAVSHEHLDVDAAEILLGAFVAQVLVRQSEWWLTAYDVAVNTLANLLDPEAAAPAADEALQVWAVRALQENEVLGADAAGGLTLHPALHGPIAKGLLLAQALMRATA